MAQATTSNIIGLRPEVEDILQPKEKSKSLTATFRNVDVCYVNALRRTILSDIPTIVLDVDNMLITKNTSGLNNELLKQRLSCVPVYANIQADAAELLKYGVYVNVVNQGNETMNVTTDDFRIYALAADQETKEVMLREPAKLLPPDVLPNVIFPKYSIGGKAYPIDVIRLQPAITGTSTMGEALQFESKFKVSTQAENSCHSVVSLCTFNNAIDVIKAQEAFRKANLDDDKDPQKIADFQALEAKRYTKPDEFEFKLKSIGPLPPVTIILEAFEVLLRKLSDFDQHVGLYVKSASDDTTTLPYAYEAIIPNEGHTLGRILEFELNEMYFVGKKKKALSYVGFRKSHPHIDNCCIRLAFLGALDDAGAVMYFQEAAQNAIAKVKILIAAFTSTMPYT
jgi:DNA-directed RNA polymerase subunit L